MSTTGSNTSAHLPNSRTALYDMVQDRLTAAAGQTLAEFIVARREPGSEVPYRHIAQELIDVTGVDITHEAVRRWYHRAVGEAAEAGAVTDAEAARRRALMAEATEAEMIRRSAEVEAALR